MLRSVSFFVAGLVLGVPLTLFAIDLPHNFVNGQITDANAINANFDALRQLIEGFDGVQRPCDGVGMETFDGPTGTWFGCAPPWNCVDDPGHAGCGSSSDYQSCLDIASDPGFGGGSQVYWVDPDGVGGDDPQEVYCDMETDGGGWTLMAKFSQHTSVVSMSAATYSAYFDDGLWIEGASEGSPLDTTGTYDDFHVESLDWRKFLAPGAQYALRQRAYKGSGTDVFDVAYDFTYGGFVVQNDTPESERSWSLTNRRVLTDETGIAWHTPIEAVHFWLPFRSIGVEGALYTACGSFDFSSSGCLHTTTTARRYGNAGIMGSSADSADPALAWMPHTNISSAYDILFAHGDASSTYGVSGDPMVGMYWIR